MSDENITAELRLAKVLRKASEMLVEMAEENARLIEVNEKLMEAFMEKNRPDKDRGA